MGLSRVCGFGVGAIVVNLHGTLGCLRVFREGVFKGFFWFLADFSISGDFGVSLTCFSETYFFRQFIGVFGGGGGGLRVFWVFGRY